MERLLGKGQDRIYGLMYTDLIIDPINLLRTASIVGDDRAIKDGMIVIGGTPVCKRAMSTNYVVDGSEKDGWSKKHYTMDAVVFLDIHRKLRHHNYVKKAEASRVQVVSVMDREALLAYLDGEIEAVRVVAHLSKAKVTPEVWMDVPVWRLRPSSTDKEDDPTTRYISDVNISVWKMLRPIYNENPTTVILRDDKVTEDEPKMSSEFSELFKEVDDALTALTNANSALAAKAAANHKATAFRHRREPNSRNLLQLVKEGRALKKAVKLQKLTLRVVNAGLRIQRRITFPAYNAYCESWEKMED